MLEIALYWKTGTWVYINPGEINVHSRRLKLRLRTSMFSRRSLPITNIIMIITRFSICFSPNGAWEMRWDYYLLLFLLLGDGRRMRSQARPYHTLCMRLFIIPSLLLVNRLFLKFLLLSCILFLASGKGSSVIHLHSAVLPRNAN